MPKKRTSTPETPAITLDAIRQLIADFTAALEAQTSAMASASNPNRNTNLTGNSCSETGNYKEFYQLSNLFILMVGRAVLYTADAFVPGGMYYAQLGNRAS
ncbi:hypothetical protein Tco_0399924 [Tanacetum coccineum]